MFDMFPLGIDEVASVLTNINPIYDDNILRNIYDESIDDETICDGNISTNNHGENVVSTYLWRKYFDGMFQMKIFDQIFQSEILLITYF